MQRKEHYIKLQAAGQTQEAKDDLARLAEVRKRREMAAAASGSSGLSGAPGKVNESESDISRIEEDDSHHKDNSEEKGKNDFPKLDALQIKKMNPTKLKELLKQRGESLQGSKKDLMMRLLAWEENSNS